MHTNTDKKLNKKEIIFISFILAILAIGSSFAYIGNGFILALIVLLIPFMIYIFSIYKFGSEYLFERFSNAKIISTVFSLINKTLKINNLKTDIGDGSATKKSRYFVISVLSVMMFINYKYSQSMEVKLGTLLLYLPLFYVIAKGYKLAFFTLFAIKLNDTINIIITQTNMIKGLLIFIILSIVYLYGLWIEDNRTKFENQGLISKTKDKSFIDFMITITLYIICFAVALFIIM